MQILNLSYCFDKSLLFGKNEEIAIKVMSYTKTRPKCREVKDSNAKSKVLGD